MREIESEKYVLNPSTRTYETVVLWIWKKIHSNDGIKKQHNNYGENPESLEEKNNDAFSQHRRSAKINESMA